MMKTEIKEKRMKESKLENAFSALNIALMHFYDLGYKPEKTIQFIKVDGHQSKTE